MKTTTTLFQILEMIAKIAPTMNPERFVIYAKECGIAEFLNKRWGTDYEASTNCVLEGVDLISKSGQYPPVQVKTCMGTASNQSARMCRGDIVRKATKVHPNAIIVLARFSGATIEKMWAGAAFLVQDLEKPHISFAMCKRWGFNEIV